MKLNDPRHPWPRLVAAARQIPHTDDVTAPYGFATRVAALGFAQERRASLFERFALRALGTACLLAVASVAINYSTIAQPVNKAVDDEVQFTPVEDPVSVLLDA
jgi:hypothetical protein